MNDSLSFPAVVDDHRPRVLALMITRRCNMRCAHCSVESTPEVEDLAHDQRLAQRVREAAAAGIESIQLTGGEPMIHPELCLSLIRMGCDLGLRVAMVTNGFWGGRRERAEATVGKLHDAGLGLLTVSYDRFHAESQSIDSVVHIADAAERLGWYMHVNFTRGRDDSELEPWVERLASYRFVRLRFYDVQPVGSARGLDRQNLRSCVEGACAAACTPAITDDDRLTVCNGPSYFLDEDSPLVLGHLERTPMAELLRRDATDPILSEIRTSGPSGLRDALVEAGGVEGLDLDRDFSGICELCQTICGSSEATATLRRVLSGERLVAERAAVLGVMTSEQGPDREWTNGPGAARLVLTGLGWVEGDLARQASQVLGAADLDWRFLAEQIESAGLAGPALEMVRGVEVRQWAPRFFIERIEKSATVEALHTARQRAVLAEIEETLAQEGGRAVLLKGMALQSIGDPAQMRATGDIDLLLSDPGAARSLHDLLRQRGFESSGDAERTGPHHLAGLERHGILVEVHDRIMPAFWGLPESKMLSTVRPADRFGAHFDVMSETAMFFHAAVHCSAHLYAQGLKTAWDLAVLSQLGDLDWAAMSKWAVAMRMPLAWHVPVEELRCGLRMPWPSTADEVTTGMGRKLSLVADHRLFRVNEGPFEMNPWAKTVLFLMMHRSLSARARYCWHWLASSPMREARRAARSNERPLRQSLAEAFDLWRRYRVATRPSLGGP